MDGLWPVALQSDLSHQFGSTHHELENSANENPALSTIELKDNTVIVVLGASGDLAKKKTVSATRLSIDIESMLIFCSSLLSSVS